MPLFELTWVGRLEIAAVMAAAVVVLVVVARWEDRRAAGKPRRTVADIARPCTCGICTRAATRGGVR